MNSKLSTTISSRPTGQPASDPKADVHLSVVLPVYQEQGIIRGIIDNLVTVLREIDPSFEIIVVDDGSTDDTPEILDELLLEYPDCFRVVHHPYNKGNGSAVKSGMRAARGELIACMDGDGQHDPRDLKNMIPLMEQYDLVVGARPRDHKAQWYRKLANGIYNSLSSWLTDFKIEDLTSGYRLFRASAILKYVSLFPARFSYPTTSTMLMLKGGYNLKYVPINIQQRQAGTSKVKLFRDGWRFIMIIFKIVLLFEPSRIFFPISLLSFLLAIASSVYSSLYVNSLRIPNSAVLLFVLSVLVILIGMVSEQIAGLQVTIIEKSSK